MKREEIWKPIKGYEGLYEVSNTGKCRSLDHYITRVINGGLSKRLFKGKVLRNHTGGNGYVMMSLSKEGIVKHFCLHRLVAEAFIPNPNNFKCINHKDENKLNNSVDNLEWCTHKYNDNYGTRPQRLSETHLKNPPRFRMVAQYSKNGEFIKTFHSATSASREIGIDSSWVIACCRGTKGALTAGGFKWKYADE